MILVLMTPMSRKRKKPMMWRKRRKQKKQDEVEVEVELGLDETEVEETGEEPRDEGETETEVDEDDDTYEEPDEELIKEIIETVPSTESDVEGFQKIVDHRKKLQGFADPTHRLTKYELTALIGFRAQQLAEGAPPYIKVSEGTDPITIAIAEFDLNLIPLMIERPFPSNKIGRFKYESFKLDELINVLPS